MIDSLINKTIDCIKRNHADARQYLSDGIQFTVTASGKEQVGYTMVVHTGSGWTITIGHAIVPGALYEIRAVYGDDDIVWIGSGDGTNITEESYVRR